MSEYVVLGAMRQTWGVDRLAWLVEAEDGDGAVGAFLARLRLQDISRLESVTIIDTASGEPVPMEKVREMLRQAAR